MRFEKSLIGLRAALAALIGIALWPTSPAHAAPPYQKTVAGITDNSRDTGAFADYLRLIWVQPGTQVTFIGRNDSAVMNRRAFVTATSFFKPAVTVDQFAMLVGNYYPEAQDLVLMRCRPSPAQKETLSPILATWPNVYEAIVADFQNQGFSCPADPSNGNNVMYCAALSYADSQRTVFVDGLATALSTAMQIFQSSATSPGALALKTNYGIYPSFTGLGFTVSGSGMVPTDDTTQMLRESIVPEYLLKNNALAEVGCRCIQVPVYGNRNNPDLRHGRPVNPNYVWQRGKLDSGRCREVPRLGTAMSGDGVSSFDAAATQSDDDDQ
jgi:hypothetical protein